MTNPCVRLQICEDGVWAHFHVPGGVYWSTNLSVQGTMASRFGAQYREWVATNESATRAALASLLDDVESAVDMGMPFENPENGFHESVMAARKALGAIKDPNWTSRPICCPHCGSKKLVGLGSWKCQSDDDPANVADLEEFQCEGSCQGRSFWA